MIKLENKNLILAITCLLSIACLPVAAFCEQAPEEIWSKRYDRAGEDRAKRLCVDRDGNIYVAGYSNNGSNNDLTIIKYSPNGIPIWVRNIDKGGVDEGHDIILDDLGYIYVAGCTKGANLDGFIVKMDSNGDTVWERSHDVSGSKLYSLTSDNTGNIFVCGYSDAGGASKNFFAAKCNVSGETFLWTYTYDSGSNDEAKAIAVAPDGSSYVTGVANDNNIFTVKLDSFGNTAWTAAVAGSSSNVAGNDISLTSDGSILVAGTSNTGFTDNCILINYRSDSSVAWTQTIDKGGIDRGFSVMVDQSGYIYIGAESYNTANFDFDWLIAKFTSDGSPLWTRYYDSGDTDREPDLKTDASGYVYLTGYSHNGANNDFLTIKYTTVPGILPPQSTGEVRIGSTGKQGIVYPLQGDKAIIAVKPATAGRIVVKIYTVTGNYVTDNVFDVLDPLDSSKNYWLRDCYNSQGSPVVSGTYIVYVEGPGIRVSKKVIIIR